MPIPKEFELSGNQRNGSCLEMARLVKLADRARNLEGELIIPFGRFKIVAAIGLCLPEGVSINRVWPAGTEDLRRLQANGILAKFGVAAEFMPRQKAVMVKHGDQCVEVHVGQSLYHPGMNEQEGRFTDQQRQIMVAALMVEDLEILAAFGVGYALEIEGHQIGDRYYLEALALPGRTFVQLGMAQPVEADFDPSRLYLVGRGQEGSEAKVVNPFLLIRPLSAN